MSTKDEKAERKTFFHYVEYLRECPHRKFTAPQIGYIRSIDGLLSPEEVDAVSRVESFKIRLEDGEVRCHEVPGLRPTYGNTVVYLQRYSEGPFAEFMEQVMDHIAGTPQGPEMFLRFIDPIRILIDHVGTFYPISYGVGAMQWRDKVWRKIAEVGALTGEFENGKFVLSDGRTYSVASLHIERSNHSGPGYARDW